jgi:HD-like signal output (HDOD) protein/ActR/RegA family two-component response regulator
MIKPGIIFVDDEIHIIDGLKRMLHQYKNDWDMYFAHSGAEALQLMAEKPVSVIITDMKMPNMNGAELLEIVQMSYPEVIRIILSGHSDEDLILRAAKNVHQFLAKPCSSEIIINTIKRTFYLKSFLNSKSLEKIINGIKDFPSVPALYHKIESELNSNSISLNKVAELISHDVGISAKILQVVNSAFFGMPVKIANIDNAVNLLGINTIKSLLLYLNLDDYYKINSNMQPFIEKLWAHSFKVARNTQIIYLKEIDNNILAKEAYAAGLLHDIGKFVLLSYEGYVSNVLTRENIKISPIEYKMLGVTHAEVGAYLLDLWNLPNQIIEAVAFHNKPHIQTDFNLSTAVYAANLLTHEDFEERIEGLDQRIIDKLPGWKELILQNECIEELL